MSGLASTIAHLAKSKAGWAKALNAVPAEGAPPRSDPSRLTQVTAFGSNPGGLEMFAYVPPRLSPRPALVVVLHGCGQDANGYDHGSGWSDLADRHGFVLLYPQQTRANNPKACFNWFMPADITRDRGEALSVRQMIEAAVVSHGIDRARIYVTGLSAGGAMAAVMLATYPELFAAGAVIAGLPYGAAANVQDALNAMFTGRSHSAEEWGDRVRAASAHEGPWPRISIWHGATDTVVKPLNAAELIKQWTDVHHLPMAAARRSVVDGHVRDVWTDAAGTEVIESFTIAGMGHGTPLHVGLGDDQGGAAGPFLLDVGISSSHHIAAFWGLTGWRAPAERPVTRASQPLVGDILPPGADNHRSAEPQPDDGGASILNGLAATGVQPEVLATIRKAFRAAGLTTS